MWESIVQWSELKSVGCRTCEDEEQRGQTYRPDVNIHVGKQRVYIKQSFHLVSFIYSCLQRGRSLWLVQATRQRLIYESLSQNLFMVFFINLKHEIYCAGSVQTLFFSKRQMEFLEGFFCTIRKNGWKLVSEKRAPETNDCNFHQN